MTASRPILMLLAVVIFAAVTAGVALYLRRRKRAAAAIGDRHLLPGIAGSDLAPPRARAALVIAAALALAAALLDPGLAATPAAGRGPVVLLLDVSGSMLASEDGTSRIETERALAGALLESIPDVPVGIVAFSGSAFSLTPPTRDRQALTMYLESLDPTIVTQSGSGLGAALRQGVGLLGGGNGSGGGSLVLVSDGDDTESRDEALAAAELARSEGIVVHVLGIGSEVGAPVPALDLATGVASGFLRDSTGEVLVSRLNADLLAEIASRGGGGFGVPRVPAEAATVLADVEEPAAISAGAGRMPVHAWLALAAFFLLLVEPLARPKARRS